MRPKKKGIKNKVANLDICVFCGDHEDNEQSYGKKLSKSGTTVHYYCMLFASALCQSGKTDDDGLLGFLAKDIMKEVNRGKRLKCSHCKKAGATIGCVTASCKLKYHFGCGLRNDTLYQYFGSYSSFCVEHRPRQAQPVRERLSFKGVAKTCCSICMCAVTARASNNTLRSPCCKNSWFHRECIQSMAHSSGLHFFKCPLCNNKELFQEEMLTYGIYIPDQDAAWELEPNAYEDLLQRPNKCDLENCVCPHGPEHSKLGTEWELMRCDYCGSAATHLKCSDLNSPMDDWCCIECSAVFGSERPKRAKQLEPKKPFPDNFLEEKFRKASKGKSPALSRKRKWNGDTTDGEPSPISGKKKRKRRKLLIKGFKIGGAKHTRRTTEKKESSVTNESKKVLSSQKCEIETINAEMQQFLGLSPSTSNSDSEINFSIDSVNSLRKKLFTKCSRKQARNLKRTLKRALSVGSNLQDGSVKNIAKGLKRTKSLCPKVDTLKKDEQILHKSEPRKTMRSKKAKESAVEFQFSDIEHLPLWVKKMHEDNIMAGQNLGDQFIKASPTVNKSTPNKVKDCKTNVTTPRSSKRLIEIKKEPIGSIDSEAISNNKQSCHKELKQLFMTDFISGKNLGAKFAHQSPSKLINSEKTKPNKERLKLKVPKAKKSLSVDSGVSMGYDENISNNEQKGNQEALKDIASQKQLKESLKVYDYDSESTADAPESKMFVVKREKDKKSEEFVRRNPFLNLSSNCGRASPNFRKSVFSKKFQLLNRSDENVDLCSPAEHSGCSVLDSNEVGRIRPSPSLSQTGRNSKRLSSQYRTDVKTNTQKSKHLIEYDVNGNVSPVKKTKGGNWFRGIKTMSDSFLSYMCSKSDSCTTSSIRKIDDQSWGRSDRSNTPRSSQNDVESDSNSDTSADSLLILNDNPMPSTLILPLEPGYDSETRSCNGDDSICITGVQLPPGIDENDDQRSEDELLEEDSLDLESLESCSITEDEDDHSIIVLDSSSVLSQEKQLLSASNNINLINNSCLYISSSSSSESASYVSNTKNNKRSVRKKGCIKSIGTQSTLSVFDAFNITNFGSDSSDNDEENVINSTPCGKKNQNNVSMSNYKSLILENSAMGVSPIQVSGPCSFVMLGEVKNSKMCVIS